MSSDVVLRVNNVGKCYEMYNAPHHRLFQTLFHGRRQFYKEFWALRDVSFEVKSGECVGIIGRNGSGKSTLLQVIVGTLAPTLGNVEVTGRVSALLELGSGFNPEFTGRENVYMNGAILGLSKSEIDKKFNEIAAFADIGEFIEQPVKIYSSGMYVRLAFAIAINTDPNILIIDEALAVGDMSFQKKCMERIDDFRDEGKTIIFCSHDMHMIGALCDCAMWLKDGAIAEIGKSEMVISSYVSWMLNANKSSHGPTQASLINNPNFYIRNSEEVEIISVKLYDVNGIEKEVFFNGDDLTFEVTYNAINSIKCPNYSVILFRDDKVPVGIGKMSYKKALKPEGIVSGITTFKVILKDVQLNSGQYTFGISVWDKANKINFANNITRKFEIKSLNIVFGPTEEKCVYFPEMEWIC